MSAPSDRPAILPDDLSTLVEQPAEERSSLPRGRRLSVAGLFSGIGGIELGLHAAEHRTELLCEIDDAATQVLRTQFPTIEVVSDVRAIDRLPDVELVTAGFPCQDLSQAGRTAGIAGRNSGLVENVFRLISDPRRSVQWLLLENVPFMLQLDRGKAMQYLVDSIEALEFMWAYRVVDTRSFGLPQRRQRVIFLASRTDDPRTVLFADNASEPSWGDEATSACGFYWTEGTRGLGWAVDAIPTLKGGSGLGIPSPPAIRRPGDRTIVVPDIRDAERLQGFAVDWTAPGARQAGRREGARWKMVGNAVSVPVFEWIGERLANPRVPLDLEEREHEGGRWPKAAWGVAGERFEVSLSPWPVNRTYEHLEEFLEFEPRPLSSRATAGFLSRARASSLRFPDRFLDDVADHFGAMSRESQAA